MERNHPDELGQRLRQALSGAAPNEVHQRTQQHFESLAAQMRQEASGPAPADHQSQVSVFGFVETLWRELFWSCRRIWAGFAVAWLMLLAVNVVIRSSTVPVDRGSAASLTDVQKAWEDQERLMVELEHVRQLQRFDNGFARVEPLAQVDVENAQGGFRA